MSQDLQHIPPAVAAYLSSPDTIRTALERDGFYALLPGARFYFYGTAAQPGGRTFSVMSLAGSEGAALRSFPEIAANALDRQAGLMIVDDVQRLNILELMSFGAVWAFHEFSDLRGPPIAVAGYRQAIQANPDDPLHATRNIEGQTSIGVPSEQILPPFVKDAMRQELQQSLHQDVDADFSLVGFSNYILEYRIRISVNAVITPEMKAGLEERLSWYMPSYMPLVVAGVSP